MTKTMIKKSLRAYISGDKEIDFVCGKRGEKLYVQVAYLLASDETVRREFGAYDNIRDFLLAEEWN